MSITVKCLNCQTVGAVNRVTAGLTCGCGSRKIALHEPTFGEFMASSGGTGWNQSRPDPLKGWSEYVGPMPGPNDQPTPAGPGRCGNCNGSGRSLRERCRACGGTGHRTPTTSASPEPYVKRHNGPSTQTSKPFMGRRKQAGRPDPEGEEGRWEEKPEPGRVFKTPEDIIRSTTPGWATGDGVTHDTKLPNTSPHLKTRDDQHAEKTFSDDAIKSRRSQGYPMHDADCPSCGHAPTHLVNDYKDDAWWHCPNCGPLENIDRKPHIDPYNPPKNFKANPRSFKAGNRREAVERKGGMLRLLASIHSTNPGLDNREAVGIARYTVNTYGE